MAGETRGRPSAAWAAAEAFCTTVSPATRRAKSVAARPHAGCAKGQGEMARNSARDGLRQIAAPLGAQRADIGAGVDFERADGRAQRAAGAGGVAGIIIGLRHFGELRGVRIVAAQAAHFARRRDALARRQGQAFRGTLRLAEAAFDAGIDQRRDRRHGFQILQVNFGIVIEQHAGIEQVFRIEQRLDPPHRRRGDGAPFALDEGRHVAPGAVLGLERAVIFADDQLGHRLHEGAVAGDFLFGFETLREHEMQIAFERMAENDRLVVAVGVEQGAQVAGRLGQPRDGKGDVLDDHRGARRPLAADRRERPLADVPEPAGFDGVRGEIHAIEGGRRVDGCGDRRQPLAQIVGIGGARLDQQRRGFRPERRRHRPACPSCA